MNRNELRVVILAWGAGSDSEGSWQGAELRGDVKTVCDISQDDCAQDVGMVGGRYIVRSLGWRCLPRAEISMNLITGPES